MTGTTEDETHEAPRTSVVRIRVGELDAPQARELRLVLRDLADRPHTRVVVDLSELDDLHELTMFRILTDAGRRFRDPGSELVVAEPSRRMASLLRATDLAHAPDGLFPVDRPCDLRMDFGSTHHAACVFLGDPAGPAAETATGTASERGVCRFGDICVGPSLAAKH